MAEINPPWTLEQLATHHANVNRMYMAAATDRAEGTIYGLAVSQRGAGANMSVDVAVGSAVVFGDENEQQGTYGVTNDAAKNVVIAAADPTNPRRDLIVCRVRDAFYSGATNAWDLFVVQGTPAGSPADPSVPNNCLTLARVAVAAAAASITNANITDLRPSIPLGIIPGNSARRPGVLYGAFSQEPAFKPVPAAGQMFYEQDTNLLYVYNGSAWVCITPVTANTATAETRASTSYGNLSGGATGPAVSLQTGTKALVTLQANLNDSGGTSAVFMGFIVSGASTVAGNDNLSLANAGAAGLQVQAAAVYQISGLTAGVNTFTAVYRAAGGTISASLRSITVVGIP